MTTDAVQLHSGVAVPNCSESIRTRVAGRPALKGVRRPREVLFAERLPCTHGSRSVRNTRVMCGVTLGTSRHHMPARDPFDRHSPSLTHHDLEFAPQQR